MKNKVDNAFYHKNIPNSITSAILLQINNRQSKGLDRKKASTFEDIYVWN